ncbi:MAG TPA: hypothetical protein VMV69_08655 [Pirellulales bacterium]|nr:hypothetical protein [Pirellulales bacterium]
MRMLMSCGAAVALLASAAIAGDLALKSGLKVGDPVGPFQVVKCAGAADDNVKEGQELCYR